MSTTSIPSAAIGATGQGGAQVTPSTTTPATGATTSTPFGLTTGWYVFFGIGAGVLLSNTKAAPIVLAILSSALLYQIGQLVEGK